MTQQEQVQAQKPEEVSSSLGKRLSFFALVGAFMAIILVSMYMPRLIEWYSEPPTDVGVSCTQSIRWAIGKFQWAQLISLGVGAVLGGAVGFRFRK